MINIRNGLFETNSSSVHSLTMTSGANYDKWVDGDIVYDENENEFITLDEAKARYNILDTDYSDNDELIKLLSTEWVYTLETYEAAYDYCELFSDSYITENGERVVAFGYYGHD